jgi:hypothetical protein
MNTFGFLLTLIFGNKIQAIKVVRAGTNMGLREAKDFIEAGPVLFTDPVELANFLNRVVLDDEVNRETGGFYHNDGPRVFTGVKVEPYTVKPEPRRYTEFTNPSYDSSF